MPKVTVVTRKSEARVIEAAAGLSLMTIIRDAGFDELLALCGGCCSCATCRVHVDPEWPPKLAPMTQDDNDLLESSSERDSASRLSCQIPFSAALNGLTVAIAAEG